MVDREKVLKGLEAHATGLGCMKTCPYWRRGVLTCAQELAADALALLKDSEQDEGWICEKQISGGQTTDLLCACGKKAREPRVMTLEETGKADISWLELKDMNHVMPCRIRYSDGWFIKLFEGSPEWFAESEYGTEFRCWTSRPTDEQRKATPWRQK